MKFANIALACVLCAPAWAERQSFPPADQANQDPALIAFRDDLLAKIAARDTEAVVGATCPDLYISHGAESGPEAFRTALTQSPDGTSDPKRPEVYWATLEDTLSQPGYFDDQGEFWMPHQWQITLPANLDPQIAFFVTGSDVSFRKQPSRAGPVAGLVSHEIVLIPNYQPEAEYQLVRLTDGAVGYLHSDYLWSMTGYRAALVKSDVGDWQLCTFVTGD